VTIDIQTGLAEHVTAAFRGYPTGVAILTAAGSDGPIGLTASSVASVSIAPAALSFSLMDTPTAREIATASSLVVHLLGAAHAGLAADFAAADGPRFTADQGWATLPTGEPILAGVPAALRCAPLHRVPVGTSTVIVASILDVVSGPPTGRLVYHDRAFHSSPAVSA
jgi:flavin reductase (DIM6/NTAB) family NADH-FMN oxidoreductase RutF